MQTNSVTSYIPIKPKYDCWQWALVAKSPWHRQNMDKHPHYAGCSWECAPGVAQAF
jgi:hypothetical protein